MTEVAQSHVLPTEFFHPRVNRQSCKSMEGITPVGSVGGGKLSLTVLDQVFLTCYGACYRQSPA